jgi:hypothetical protein
MFFELLQKNLPSYFVPRENIKLESHEIKYGFNSNIKFEYNDAHGSIANERRGALMTNSATMVSNYVGKVEPDTPIYDGIRNDIVDTNGAIDVGLMEELLVKSLGRRYASVAIADAVVSAVSTKNAVSLIYNMLRLLLIKQHSHLHYDHKGNYYNNGHVKITHGQVFPGLSGNLGESVRITPGDVSTSNIAFEGELDGNSIAWKNNLTQACYNVIRDAAGEWERMLPFGIAHSSPDLTQFEGLKIISRTPPDRSTDGYEVKDIIEAITTLVTSNKLYTDFDIAYFMIAQVFLSPVPRCAESAAWFMNEATVYMPELSINTGELPFLLSGTEYVRDDSWRVTFDSWRKAKDAVFYHSIVLNEDVYLELASVARVKDTEAVNSGNFTELSISGAPLSYRGMLTDLTLIATRRGNNIDLPYGTSCGLARNIDFIHESYIDVPIIVTDAEADAYYNIVSTSVPVEVSAVRTLRVTSITPPLYPVFSYGLNTDDLFADKLSDEVEIVIETQEQGVISITDPRVFSKFMNILRMMGNDVTATERLTGKKVTNWSDNGVGRFVYTDVQYGAQAVYDIRQEDIVQRNHNWVNIGSMYGHVKLSYNMTNMRARVMSGNRDINISGGLLRTIKPTKMAHLREQILASPDSAVIHALKKTIMPDFRFVRLEIPGLPDLMTPGFGRQRVQQVDPANLEPTSQEAGLDVPAGEIDSAELPGTD